MAYRPHLTLTDADAHLRLSVYVTDHLAGAKAGLALARRFTEHLGASPEGAVMEEVTAEIAAEVATLVEITAELGVSRVVPKELMALAGERLSRAKPNGQLLGRSPLAPLIELEALTAGVAGKRGLWRSLRAALPVERHETPTFDDLLAQADSQLARLDSIRDGIARTALAE